MIFAVYLFPIHQDIAVAKVPFENIQSGSVGDQIAKLVTTNDFFELFLRDEAAGDAFFGFVDEALPVLIAGCVG